MYVGTEMYVGKKMNVGTEMNVGTDIKCRDTNEQWVKSGQDLKFKVQSSRFKVQGQRVQSSRFEP